MVPSRETLFDLNDPDLLTSLQCPLHDDTDAVLAPSDKRAYEGAEHLIGSTPK